MFAAEQGEPLQFGIEEEMVETFLADRGFSQIHNVTSEDYKKAYFHGVNKDRSVCNLLSFAYAVVKWRLPETVPLSFITAPSNLLVLWTARTYGTAVRL